MIECLFINLVKICRFKLSDDMNKLLFNHFILSIFILLKFIIQISQLNSFLEIVPLKSNLYDSKVNCNSLSETLVQNRSEISLRQIKIYLVTQINKFHSTKFGIDSLRELIDKHSLAIQSNWRRRTTNPTFSHFVRHKALTLTSHCRKIERFQNVFERNRS